MSTQTPTQDLYIYKYSIENEDLNFSYVDIINTEGKNDVEDKEGYFESTLPSPGSEYYEDCTYTMKFKPQNNVLVHGIKRRTIYEYYFHNDLDSIIDQELIYKEDYIPEQGSFTSDYFYSGSSLMTNGDVFSLQNTFYAHTIQCSYQLDETRLEENTLYPRPDHWGWVKWTTTYELVAEFIPDSNILIEYDNLDVIDDSDNQLSDFISCIAAVQDVGPDYCHIEDFNNDGHGNKLSADRFLNHYSNIIQINFNTDKLQKKINHLARISWLDTIFHNDNSSDDENTISSKLWHFEYNYEMINFSDVNNYTNKKMYKISSPYENWPYAIASQLKIDLKYRFFYGISNRYLLCDKDYKIITDYTSSQKLSNYINTNISCNLKHPLIGSNLSFKSKVDESNNIYGERFKTVTLSNLSIESYEPWTEIIQQETGSIIGTYRNGVENLINTGEYAEYVKYDLFNGFSNKFYRYLGSTWSAAGFTEFIEYNKNNETSSYDYHETSSYGGLAAVFTANSYASFKSKLKAISPSHPSLRFAGFAEYHTNYNYFTPLSAYDSYFFPAFKPPSDQHQFVEYFKPVNTVLIPVFFTPDNALINLSVYQEDKNVYNERKQMLESNISELSSHASYHLNIDNVKLTPQQGKLIQGTMKILPKYYILDVIDKSQTSLFNAIRFAAKCHSVIFNIITAIKNGSSGKPIIMLAKMKNSNNFGGYNSEIFRKILKATAKNVTCILTANKSTKALSNTASICLPNKLDTISNSGYFAYIVDTASTADPYWSMNNKTFAYLISKYITSLDGTIPRTINKLTSIRQIIINAFNEVLKSFKSLFENLTKECLLKKIHYIDNDQSIDYKYDVYKDIKHAIKNSSLYIKKGLLFNSFNTENCIKTLLSNHHSSIDALRECDFLKIFYAYIGIDTSSTNYAKYSWYSNFRSKITTKDITLKDDMLNSFFILNEAGIFNDFIANAASNNYANIIRNVEYGIYNPISIQQFHEDCLQQFELINTILISTASEIYENTLRIFQESDEAFFTGLTYIEIFDFITILLMLNLPHCGFLTSPADNAIII